MIKVKSQEESTYQLTKTSKIKKIQDLLSLSGLVDLIQWMTYKPLRLL